MSHFYASISGTARTSATRCGSKVSGIMGHIRGWDVGVRVQGVADVDRDKFYIFATGGSNGRMSERPVAIVEKTPTGNVEVYLCEW